MKISATKNRLTVLNERLEKLIELNQKHHYTSSFSNERKIKQYYSLLTRIRSEKQDIHIAIRENNAVYNSHVEKAKNNVVDVLRNHFLHNLKPAV